MPVDRAHRRICVICTRDVWSLAPPFTPIVHNTSPILCHTPSAAFPLPKGQMLGLPDHQETPLFPLQCSQSHPPTALLLPSLTPASHQPLPVPPTLTGNPGPCHASLSAGCSGSSQEVGAEACQLHCSPASASSKLPPTLSPKGGAKPSEGCLASHTSAPGSLFTHITYWLKPLLRQTEGIKLPPLLGPGLTRATTSFPCAGSFQVLQSGNSSTFQNPLGHEGPEHPRRHSYPLVNCCLS